MLEQAGLRRPFKGVPASAGKSSLTPISPMSCT